MAVVGSVAAPGGVAALTRPHRRRDAARATPAPAARCSGARARTRSTPSSSAPRSRCRSTTPNPAAGTIDLAVIRLPAAGRPRGRRPAQPGRPGGIGLRLHRRTPRSALDRELGLGGRFDLVGFDPRGVDRSGGLRCQTDAEIDAAMYFDDTPDSPEEAAQLDALDGRSVPRASRSTATRCATTPPTTPPATWTSIRAALGDEQISYLGISYGTFLGGDLRHAVPAACRAMVLDSASERTGESSFDGTVTQLGGFEGAFANWAAWCEEGTECAFTDVDVAARWDGCTPRLDAQPVKSDRARPSTRSCSMTATIASMYNEPSGRALGSALADAEAGDGDRAARPRRRVQRAPRRRHLRHDLPVQPDHQLRQRARSSPTPATRPALLAQLQAAAPRFSRGIGIADMRDDCLDLLAQNRRADHPVVHRHRPDPRRRRAQRSRPRRSAGPRR